LVAFLIYYTKINISSELGIRNLEGGYFFATDLNRSSDLLLPNGCKVLQPESMFLEHVDELRNTYPCDPAYTMTVFFLEVEHLVHERDAGLACVSRGGERALECRERV
jgi:hypothetical protein